uniref:Uncharacterized protein n=1 Tax=Tanacetum cinerariifolium TaxID=118510 RepID=A0A6L2KKT9_TANCI|nr:hypothetical protein [Tanacetum cinerariifolium]
MHQFLNSIYKHHDFYRFRIEKKKRFKLTSEVFRDIFQIFPRIKDQDFDALPSEEDTVSFLRELGHTRVINSLNDVVIDQMHQSWRTFATLINRSLSRKTTALDKLQASKKYGAVLPDCLTSPKIKESKAYKTYLGYATGTVPPKVTRKFKKASPSKKDSVPVPADEEPVQKGKRVKKSAKKSSTTPTTGIVIKEPPVETQSKKQKSNDENNSNKDKDEENKSDDDEPPSNSEKGSDSEQDTDGSESDSESDQQDDDDDDDDDISKDDEDRGMDSDDVQDKKKTEVPITSSSCSSDLASKFLNFSDIPPADTEVVSPLDVYVHHEVPRIHKSTILAVRSTLSPLPTTATTNIPPSILDFISVFRFNDRVIALEKDVAELKNDPLHTQVTTLVDDHLDTRVGATREEFMNFLSMIQELLNQVNLAKASSQPQSTYEVAATLTKFELKKILIDKMNSSESYLTTPEHLECYDDECPSTRSDLGLNKRKTSKDAEPTTSLKTKNSSSRSSKGIKSQPKSLRKFVHVEEPEFKVGDTDTPQGQEGNQGNDNVKPRTESASRRDWFTKPSRSQEPTDLDWNEDKTPQKDQIKTGLAFRLLKGTRSNYVELEYDFKECYKALSEKIDWENLEGDDYPFNLSKPLPLITRRNHQSVPFEFFINNDLKYLQGGTSTMTYTMSTTKTKAAQYDLPGIEDMVPNMITQVSVMRKHGYGYLEEIVRVEDLQLGVKSYQKQINITKHDTIRLDLRKRHTYTPYKNPQGFIYVDDYQRNRLMRSDELYKFSDGTLTRLLSSLEDITKNIDMKYLPKRRWSTLEKKELIA